MGAGSLLLALALSVFAAKPFPEPPRDYVHNEGVVSSESEARLSARLSAFEKETGHQFVVALFGSLEGESLEDYSNRLFKHWRIGDAKRDDGVLLALFKSDRRWRVEVGYGLESTLTDLEAGAFLNERAVPRFREGDFDGGLEAAVSALVERLRTGRVAGPRDAVERYYEVRGWLVAHEDAVRFYGALLAILLLLFFIWVHGFSSMGSGFGDGDYSGGGSWSSGDFGGGSSDSGGFSGGGGDSGGGGASGSW